MKIRLTIKAIICLDLLVGKQIIFALFLLTGNTKEKERLAEGVKMQNLENKLSPILQKYVKPGRFSIKK